MATTHGYCRHCGKRNDATARRKAEREPDIQALMTRLGIERAPDDPNEAKPKTPYAQLNVRDDWAARIVVKIRNGDTCMWQPGCKHGLTLNACSDCLTIEQMSAVSSRWCRACPTAISGKQRLIGLCAQCDDGKTKIARTEIRLREPLFKAVGYPPSAVDDTYFGTERDLCNVTKSRKPDAPWLWTDRAVLCETDENSHMNSGYEPECCATWATDMATSIEGAMRKAGLDGGQVRIFIVRWNPDARDHDRPVIYQKDRARIVGARVKALLEMPAAELAKFPPAVPILIYYYYHSKAQRWIDYARGCDGIVVHDVID